MKRIMSLLLAVMMLVGLLTVGASAASDYSETVDGVTVTITNVKDTQQRVVKMYKYDYEQEKDVLVEKTITVCQATSGKTSVRFTNNGDGPIYPGESVYAIYEGGYMCGSGGQILGETWNGGETSSYPVTDEGEDGGEVWLEFGLVEDPSTMLYLPVPGETYYTFADLDKIGTEVKAEAPAAGGNPFTDIAEGDYYYEPVLWALENKVTTGMSATEFGPYETCTRAQVVTFLWRAKGCPAPKSTNNPFTDVKAGTYYYDAVLWAVEQGITNGMEADRFGINDKCTNGHVVTFLWRAEGKPAATEYSVMGHEVYAGSWYSDAIAWGDTTGLLEIDGEEFLPATNSPRANIVTYLYRNAQ